MELHFNDPNRDLFIGNLPYRIATDRELFDIAVPHGPVLYARLVLDRATGNSKGFGFVRYASPEDAARALKALDGHVVGGRVIKAKPLMRRPAPSAKEGANGQSR